MQRTIPEEIQYLEEQLPNIKGEAKGAIWIELINLYGANGQYSKLLEGANRLLKLADLHQDALLKMQGLLLFAKITNNQRQFEQTSTYLNEIESLNKKANNRKIWLKWYLLKANTAQKQHQFESLKVYVQKLFALASSEDAFLKVAAHQLLIGVHQTRNEFDLAFKHLFAALELLEKEEVKNWNYYLQTSLLSMNAVMLYRVQIGALKGSVKDSPDDITYYLEKGHKFALLIQYKPLILESQIQFGHLEGDSGNYEAAIEYYHSALEMAKSAQDEYTALYCNTFIANMHQLQHKLDIAIAHYQSALGLAVKVSSKMLVIDCGINLAKCFREQKDYLIAVKYAKEALALAEEIDITKKRLSAYELLALIYKDLNNTDEVFTYLQKYITLKDTIFTAEKEKSIVEMQTRYETEKKEQETERLRELEQVKSRFFSQITHEFRTPLTLILGPVQQILQHPKIQSDSELQNRLSLVKRNGQRLSNLVNQLLDLSKLESGKMSIENKQGDLIPFVENIVANFQSLAQQQNIRFQFDTSIPQLAVQFDGDKLEKILNNLLSNAFKFTPSNGRITLQLQTQNKTETHTDLQITLKDTGKGIEAKHLAHVFDRFYQADNSNIREVEGSGVGLSLVKELIELQGGKIEVTSEINIGTTFTFHLPLELSKAISNTSIAEKKPAQSSSFKTFEVSKRTQTTASKIIQTKVKGTGKNIVLVVEDNPDMQTYIQSILSPQYEVLQAMNGEEGVNRALEEVPDLIVSDVMMPKKDGYTLCKELKTNEKTNHIPILLLTAKAALDSRIEGLEQGADVYLSKPFSPKELLLNIENQIKVRQQLQEKYTNQILQSDEETGKETITDPFLQKLIETIETHLNDIQLSAKQLSQYMYMSRQQIHRKLKALTNYSTTEFIRLLRLQKAKNLLESRQYTMTEIAYEVGFSTPSYFSRSFVKQYGVSPSKWLDRK